MPPKRTEDEVRKKVLDYELWVNDTLKKDLNTIYQLKSRYLLEQSELQQLLVCLPRAMQGATSAPLKTMVEIGSGVYCAAKIPDASHVFVEVGLGFHVECTLGEAQDIISRKLQHVQDQLLSTDKKLAHQKATIKLAVQAIGELSGLL